MPNFRLGATDGYIRTPDGAEHYIFGFVDLTGVPEEEIYGLRGRAQLLAPLLEAYEGDEVYLTLTNLGLPDRPDLDDSHTIHWHGFPNQIPFYDGVPEASLSVPVGRDFVYHFRPRDPGTYMYHCHFEPVEHIQMGMVGPLIVRPQIQREVRYGGRKFAYDDPATEFDREHFVFLTELDPVAHRQVLSVQEFDWTEYKPQYWLLNGRSYPDTTRTEADDLPSQPCPALIQANSGDRVLLRCVNLGFQEHSIELLGIPLKVVGQDAQQPRSLWSQDLSHWCTVLYFAPGQTLDVLFTAGEPGTYPLLNRDLHKCRNAGQPPGGMVSEIRVHPPGTLPPQEGPNA